MLAKKPIWIWGQGAWSEGFELYSIGRETIGLSIYEGPCVMLRLRAPAPLSPDPLQIHLALGVLDASEST